MNKLLGQSAFWMVNKAIAKHFKCNNTALLLSYLLDSEEYYQDKGHLTPDGYFFRTSEDIENDVNISYHKQKKCIQKLKEAGFIQTKLKGLPAKLHFKVVQNKIWNFLNTVIEKTPKLELEKFKANNNLDNNNLKKEESNNSDSLPSFLERGKTAKAMAQSICFESKEQMLQEISKTEYSEYLIQASAKWRGMNEKGKSAFLDEFAGKNATIKEYGNLKETYKTGIKTHMMNSLKYYEPAKEQTTSTYAYHYKIANKVKKHNDKAMWERDKRNFGNGQGYKEIQVSI